MNVPGELRAVLRLTRCGVHLAAAAGIVALVHPFAKRGLRARLKQHWSRQLLEVLGIRLRVCGGPAGTLLVANHVSWLDIFVINACAPAAFICKADVRRWPLIGWLCSNTETIFIERGKRNAALHTLREMRARLQSGATVAVFPEGTSTDGRTVLPFHSALLQSAVDTESAVQPVAIRYEGSAGMHSRAPAYYADIGLWQSLKAIARAEDLVARADFLPPLQPTTSSDRADLARQVHCLISNRLARRGAGSAPGTAAGLPGESQSAFHPTGSPSPRPAGSAPA